MDLKQLHLTGRGFSGRGVRLRPLTNAMRAAAHTEAARALGDAGTASIGAGAIFENAKTNAILLKIVAKVTDAVKPEEILKAQWRKVDAMALGIDGAGSLHDLFTTKDIDVLGTYIQRTYYATVGEADTILGGMLAVSDSEV